MIFVGVALHLFLFGCETAVYSILLEKYFDIYLLNLGYISNQVTYYEKLPDLNYFFIGIFILIPIASILLYIAYKKNRKFVYILLLIYLSLYCVYLFIIEPNIEALITKTYGTSAEYFNQSVLSYFFLGTSFWIVIVAIHSLFEIFLERIGILQERR